MQVLVVIALMLAIVATPRATAAAAQPHDVMLVLDNSGSMRANDPQFLTAVAVRAFIADLRGDARLGMIVFDEDVEVVVPLSPLTEQSRTRFLDSLGRIDFSGQWTRSSAALERALYALRTEARADARRSIVFVTDGIVDTGDAERDAERRRWMQEELSAEAAEAGVRIFGVAFTDGADFQLIQSLAHRTGGDYFRAYTAGDMQRVFAGVNTGLDSAPAESPAALADPAPPPVPQLPPAEPPSLYAASPPAARDEPLAGAPDAGIAKPTRRSVAAPSAAAPALNADADAAYTAPGAAPAWPSASAADAGERPRRARAVDNETPPPPASASPSAAADTGDDPYTAPSAEAGHVEPGVAPEPLAADATGQRFRAAVADVRSPAAADAGATAAGLVPALHATEQTPTAAWLFTGGGVLALLAAVGLLLRQRPGATPGAESVVPRAFLEDVDGATDRASHELGAVATTVGRLRGQETGDMRYLVIGESTVGRRHALIEYRDGAYWVTDQHSLNGTFLNGERVREPSRLEHGDRLRFHRREFEFVLRDPDDSDRTQMSQTRLAPMPQDLADDGDAAEAPGPAAAPARS